jgi:hypothetical protein
MGMISAVLLCVGVIASSAQSAKVDVTGAWTLTVQSDAGSSMPAVTFKQTGEKLTGHYSSMLVGEAELTGSVKNQVIEFTVRAEVQGTKFELKYEGTIEKDSMKGTLVTDFGGGTFTAKRN